MEGPEGINYQDEELIKNEHRGIIPRAVEFLYDQFDNSELKGWAYTCSVSIIEIYNSKSCSLLSGEESFVLVKNPAEVYALLASAKAKRKTKTTGCNEKSSRSHLIFTMKIVGERSGQDSTEGFMHLIDLAGSENAKIAGTVNNKELFEETKAINSSLLELNQMIRSAVSQQVFAPSMPLGKFLRPYLKPGCKTLLIINLSPESDQYARSKKSLEFAVSTAKVKKPKEKTKE